MDPLKPIAPPFQQDAEPAGGAESHPVGADPDFQLLESYLDGELTAAEANRLEWRLSAEPELSSALGRMCDDYALRQAAFRSLEPDGRAAEALNWSFARSARRIDRAALQGASRRRSLRLGRLAGALAACVAVSFCAGWVGRGYAAQTNVASAPAGHSGQDPAPRESKEEPSVYQVALTDERGNITAVQKFDKLEEAQAFAADVGRWQARQQRPSPPAEPAAPVPTTSGL